MKKLLIPIGILLVLGVAFGSMHAYASTKVNNTLEETLDGVSFGSIYFIHKLENPPRHIFHIGVRVANESRSEAVAKISNCDVTLGEFEMGIMLPIGPWEGTIHPGENREQILKAVGQITISDLTMIQLRSGGPVTLEVRGEIELSASHLWVTRTTKDTFAVDTLATFD